MGSRLNLELCLLKFGCYLRHRFRSFYILWCKVVRDQGVKKCIAWQDFCFKGSCFTGRYALPCRGGWKVRYSGWMRKQLKEAEWHWDLAVISYYCQTSLVTRGNKPLSTECVSEGFQAKMRRATWRAKVKWNTRGLQRTGWYSWAGCQE